MFKLICIIDMVIFLLWLSGEGSPHVSLGRSTQLPTIKWFLVDPPFA